MYHNPNNLRREQFRVTQAQHDRVAVERRIDYLGTLVQKPRTWGTPRRKLDAIFVEQQLSCPSRRSAQ